jgi:hypothetical protein
MHSLTKKPPVRCSQLVVVARPRFVRGLFCVVPALFIAARCGAAAAGLGVVNPPPPTPACHWTLQTVDSAVDGAGWFTSLAFDADGRPAVSYCKWQGDNLAFSVALARFNGVHWTTEFVDESGYAIGPTSLAFAPNGRPSIAYRDGYSVGSPFTPWALRFAHFNGAAWVLATVDEVGNPGMGASLAYAPNGDAAISYLGSDLGEGLRFARLHHNAWNIELLDPDATASTTSLAFRPDGNPAIAYPVSGPGMIRYTYFNGVAWITDDVDTPDGSLGSVSLAFAPDGKPAMAYSYGPGQEIRFVRLSAGGSWIDSPLGAAGATGVFPSLQFGANGRPAIAYLDLSDDASSLSIARYNGVTWTHGVVDGVVDTGAYPSLGFAPDGRPAISYQNQTEEVLRVARCNPGPVLTAPGHGRP